VPYPMERRGMQTTDTCEAGKLHTALEERTSVGRDGGLGGKHVNRVFIVTKDAASKMTCQNMLR